MRDTYTGADLLEQLLLHKDQLLTSIRREDIALDAFLRQEARRPDHNPVFQYVLKHYIGLVNPNLTEAFEHTYFRLFQEAARQPDKLKIVGFLWNRHPVEMPGKLAETALEPLAVHRNAVARDCQLRP